MLPSVSLYQAELPSRSAARRRGLGLEIVQRDGEVLVGDVVADVDRADTLRIEIQAGDQPAQIQAEAFDG